MAGQTAYSTERLDHHGIVAGICHEIELVECVDTAVGEDGRKVRVGQSVLEIILNGLGFVSRPATAPNTSCLRRRENQFY